MTEPINLHGYATITLDRETRTIRGEITKYGTATNDYRNIVIHNGAARIPTTLSRVKLLIDHDSRQPVGYMTEIDGEGRLAAFKIAPGEAGDKALADAENKLRDGLSIGMRIPDEPGASKYDADTDTFHVYAFELVEVSLVAFPAFTDARVTSVAAAAEHHPTTTLKENTMHPEAPAEGTTLTAAELDVRLATVESNIDRTIETRLAQARDSFGNRQPVNPASQFADFGAFIKALYDGNQAAKQLAESRMGYLSLEDEGAAPLGSTGDTAMPSTWVQDAIHFVNQRRPILNAFTRAGLPDEGMSLEYLQLESNSIVVDKQATEGQPLPFGKITLKSNSAPVSTYGGATSLSRQVIERANAAYITSTGIAMDLEYARRTELAVRQLLTAVIAQQKAVAGKHLDLDGNADLYDWLDLIVDANELFDDNGFALTGALVSKDVFKKLHRLEDSNGNALMSVYGTGVNRVGQIDFSGLTGAVGNVQFRLFPKAAANTFAFYDTIGLTTWESAGAPWLLSDDNIIDLTRDVAKYGYMANASQYPDAIVPVTID